jgi:hypothetical protein
MPDGTSRSYPLCAVELKDAMSGAKDSKTCYRRTQVPTNLNPDTYCDPLGDDNVVATIKGVSNQQIYPIVFIDNEVRHISILNNLPWLQQL